MRAEDINVNFTSSNDRTVIVFTLSADSAITHDLIADVLQRTARALTPSIDDFHGEDMQ